MLIVNTSQPILYGITQLVVVSSYSCTPVKYPEAHLSKEYARKYCSCGRSGSNRFWVFEIPESLGLAVTRLKIQRSHDLGLICSCFSISVGYFADLTGGGLLNNIQGDICTHYVNALDTLSS
jgi:hypothetical protein